MRMCTWCGNEAPDYAAGCPTCEAELQGSPPATREERALALERVIGVLEVDFSLLHGWIEKLVGRPVWTHELAEPERLVAEVREVRP